ncbi:MAG: DNA/RNA non-specific endonuclease [Pedobacter sp.]|nr:MAG: DNA/RNA non-specific endonuclease [Pedobacter sp.]
MKVVKNLIEDILNLITKIMSWFKDIFTSPSKDWFYSPLPSAQAPSGNDPRPVFPETEYLHIFLRSMRIVNIQKGLSKFYPTIHSHIEVGHQQGTPAIFNTVTTPGNLQSFDSTGIDKVINISRRLLGPVPYQGGGIKLEVGLFSIKEENMAEPFIKLLTNMSTLAGVSFISAALPYVKPLEDGIALLTGSGKDSVLEIGLMTEYNEPKTGYYVVMRVDKDGVDLSDLQIDPKDYRLTNKKGEAIKDYPYMVFEIIATPNREDWFNIPEVSLTYNSLRTSLKAGKLEEAKDALALLKRTMYNSADLLLQDAGVIFKKIEEQYKIRVEAQQSRLELLETIDQSFSDFPDIEAVLEGVQIYDGYEGYQEEFLGLTVAAPILGKYQDDCTYLIGTEEKKIDYVNYSVVLSKSRKFPIYSASNIDGGAFKKLGRADNWRKDTRVPLYSQWGQELYSADLSNFDRGHMTKREDVQWGKSFPIAAHAADSTFFYTNAVPQHASLNQKIWRRLEDYILHSESVEKSMLISVFTGPVLGEKDPIFVTRVNQHEIQLPIFFWKVVYYLKDEKLYRTGFLMSQFSLLSKYNIIRDEELELFSEDGSIFMSFRDAETYQVNISTIQTLTGLEFAPALEAFHSDKEIKLIEKEVDVHEYAANVTTPETAQGMILENLIL